MIRLIISRRNYVRLIELAQAALPYEACALLGQVTEGGFRQLSVYPVPNAFQSATSFCIRRQSLETMTRRMRSDGVELSGCFHSHPTAGPEPSRLDRQSMEMLPLHWLIYSVRDHSLRAFSGPRATPTPIAIR